MSCAAHALARSGGMLCEADVDLIRETVAKLPSESIVVDLGVGFGTTSLSVVAERQDVRLVSIDCQEANLDYVQNVLSKANAPMAKWHGIQADSAFRSGEVIIQHGMVFRPTLTDVALVIVDTTHKFDDTRAEIELWLPKLMMGGYMLFHDYDAKDALSYYPEVKMAVDPFLLVGKLKGVRRQGWSLLTQKVESR
jgi:cephalosporin hydroxylase